MVPAVCPITGSMMIPSFVEYLVMSKTDKDIAHAMKIEESARTRPLETSMVSYSTGKNILVPPGQILRIPYR